jgi:glutamate N-acetyltransferase/amino-acid N-acetyltransferase
MVISEFGRISGGTITTPLGYQAGAAYAGIKTYSDLFSTDLEKLDVGVILSDVDCTVAGVFTQNSLRSESVRLCEQRITLGKSRGILAVSGCANACVGNQGMIDALQATLLASQKLELDINDLLFCSTGVIGVELPMALVDKGIGDLKISPEQGHSLATAITTTDTRTKEIAVSFELDGKQICIGGIAKGAAMIHPNMATMLSFVTTDASISNELLDKALHIAVDLSFNMITIDGDTSTNDSVIVMANGASGTPAIQDISEEFDVFQRALNQVCEYLAKEIIRDAEGGTKIIQVNVENAATPEDARLAARTVAGSVLVRTAVYGNDPNWGRILAALGRSGCELREGTLALFVNDICIMEDGMPIPFFKDAVVAAMENSSITFRLDLKLGNHDAIAWSSDMTEEYVRLNSVYTT